MTRGAWRASDGVQVSLRRQRVRIYSDLFAVLVLLTKKARLTMMMMMMMIMMMNMIMMVIMMINMIMMMNMIMMVIRIRIIITINIIFKVPKRATEPPNKSAIKSESLNITGSCIY